MASCLYGCQVLYDSIHLSYCEVDTARKLILVVHGEPLVKVAQRVRLQDRRDLKGSEPLLFQDLIIFSSFRSLTESTAVGGLSRDLSEDLLGLVLIHGVEVNLICDRVVRSGDDSLVLELFHALKINHCSNDSQPLKMWCQL